MIDSSTYALAHLAEAVGAELIGDGQYLITGLQSLSQAKSGQLSFLANPSYRSYLASTEAGAVILPVGMSDAFSGHKLLVNDPYLAYAKLTRLFDEAPQAAAGVHPSAVIEAEAQLGQGVSIAANAYIGNGVVVEDGVQIGPNCSVSDACRIGANSRLYANVTLYHKVSLGQGCIVHSGTVIGADGFGFAPSADGWIKIHQLGGVQIGNQVEIGAGCTIDRGALEDTVIGNGVIIDDQVMIAHNVRVGDNTAMAGTASVAGSSVIGKNCTLAGGVGVVGHIAITDNVHVTARTMVTKSIAESGSYSSGTMMQDTRRWKKNAVRFSQLDKWVARLTALEKKLK